MVHPGGARDEKRWLPTLGGGVAALLLVRAVGVDVLLLTDAGYGARHQAGAVVLEPGSLEPLVALLLGGVFFRTAAVAAHDRGGRAGP